jgi:hypothetical protein
MSLAHSVVAHSFADKEHRGLIALALADHDRAIDGQLVELAPHGIDRRLVGSLLIAPAAQTGGRHRSTLGHTHEFHRENALDDLFLGDLDLGVRHGQKTPAGMLRLYRIQHQVPA